MTRGRFLAIAAPAFTATVITAMVVSTAVLASAGAVNARSHAPLRVLVVGESEAGTLTAGVPADTGVHGLRAQSDLAITDRTILACSISSVHAFVIDGQPADNLCGGTGKWQQQWAADVARSARRGPRHGRSTRRVRRGRRRRSGDPPG